MTFAPSVMLLSSVWAPPCRLHLVVAPQPTSPPMRAAQPSHTATCLVDLTVNLLLLGLRTGCRISPTCAESRIARWRCRAPRDDLEWHPAAGPSSPDTARSSRSAPRRPISSNGCATVVSPMIRGLHVVEADEESCSGTAARTLRRLQHSDRLDVGGREDGRRPRTARQQLGRGDACGVAAVGLAQDPFRRCPDPAACSAASNPSRWRAGVEPGTGSPPGRPGRRSRGGRAPAGTRPPSGRRRCRHRYAGSIARSRSISRPRRPRAASAAPRAPSARARSRAARRCCRGPPASGTARPLVGALDVVQDELVALVRERVQTRAGARSRMAA